MSSRLSTVSLWSGHPTRGCSAQLQGYARSRSSVSSLQPCFSGSSSSNVFLLESACEGLEDRCPAGTGCGLVIPIPQ
jgi:hypothetical protein